MPITYSIGKATILPDDNSGEYTESWIDDDNARSTFGEMVRLLQGTEPSSYPPDARDWYISPDLDPYSGIETTTSYHPRTERDGRYMHRAWRMANPPRRA